LSAGVDGAMKVWFPPEMKTSMSTSVRAHNQEMLALQAILRKGLKTSEVFFTKHIDNSRLVRVDDVETRREIRSFTAATLCFFVLTMIYCWQNFSSIVLSLQLETQRKSVADLREQNMDLRVLDSIQGTIPVSVYVEFFENHRRACSWLREHPGDRSSSLTSDPIMSQPTDPFDAEKPNCFLWLENGGQQTGESQSILR
jgi:hypothetical protein